MLLHKMKHKQGGFTLIELMFTVLVLAVLLAVGIPNFLRNSRMAAQANDLLSALNLTRSEAVKRRAQVSLCVTIDCESGDFDDGWFVFVDENQSGAFDAGEDVLRRHDPMPEGIEAAVVQTVDAEDEDAPDFEDSIFRHVTFGPSGFRRPKDVDDTMPVALGLVLCDARGNVQTAGGPEMSAARAVELTTSGRAAVTRSIDRIQALGGCP
jgi:prepilin-type N-terminal cleavage/methylation domain-containing protein